MNVFVLSTGRCGTTTFARACSHIVNYTAAHESKNLLGSNRTGPSYASLRYPENHIEVDNRLSWFLGMLEREYGTDAFYVHLLRDREGVAQSLAVRGPYTMLHAYASGILQYRERAALLSAEERLNIARHYWDTVNANIAAFLAGKPRTMTIWLATLPPGFEDFWERIGAEGDREAALAECELRYNEGEIGEFRPWRL